MEKESYMAALIHGIQCGQYLVIVIIKRIRLNDLV